MMEAKHLIHYGESFSENDGATERQLASGASCDISFMGQSILKMLIMLSFGL